MTAYKPYVSEALAFEQTMQALMEIDDHSLAKNEIDPIAQLYILTLPSTDLRKADRFLRLMDSPAFDANVELTTEYTASLPLSGLPKNTQRPMEFAIGQFLASNASQQWKRVIMRMATHPRFDGALQRPLWFSKLIVSDDASNGIPLVHKENEAAFAHAFLLQEAQHFPSTSQAAVRELAKAIELRMVPIAKSLAAEDLFMLSAFGHLATSKARLIQQSIFARSPIALRNS